MHRSSVLIAGGLWVCLGCASAQPRDGDADASRAMGLLEYETGHYTAAARYFRNAAESGDVRSAEMLCLMHRFGATFYGGQIPTSTEEAARWAALAAQKRTAVAPPVSVPGP